MELEVTSSNLVGRIVSHSWPVRNSLGSLMVESSVKESLNREKWMNWHGVKELGEDV